MQRNFLSKDYFRHFFAQFFIVPAGEISQERLRISPVATLRNFLCRTEIDNDGVSTTQVRWPRVAVAAATAFAFGVFLLTAGLWVYLAQVRGLRGVAYANTLTPTGWQKIRIEIGNQTIAEADAALRRGEIDVALRLYRVGLAKAPHNANARIALAKIYVGLRRADLARDLLSGGLPALAENPNYLQLSLTFLLDFQFDSELQRVCQELLSHPSSTVRRQAALHAAAVAFHRGNFDGAESILVSHQLTDSPDGALLLARADFERGFPELALARLSPALHDDSAQTAALALVARIQEQTGRAPDLARTSALRLADDPLSPAPRIATLHQLHAQNCTDELVREIDDYLRLFRHDQAALLALGDFAANSGRPDLARRVQQLFAERQWSPDAPALLYAEACIASGRYADGMVELDRYLRDNPAWATRYGPAFDGLRTVALLGLGRNDDAQLQLEHLLAQPNLRAENLSAVATRLLAFGRSTAARNVLDRAVDLDPHNQAALASLVRLEAELGLLDTLPAHLRQFLAMRRPSREVLTFVYHRLGSDLNLLHPEQQSLLAELRLRIGRDALALPKS